MSLSLTDVQNLAMLAGAAYDIEKHEHLEHGSNYYTILVQVMGATFRALVFRGTQNAKDVYGDTAIIGFTSREENTVFQEAVDTFQTLYEKYEEDGYPWVVIGHSLGGALASYCRSRFEHKVSHTFTFNEGGGLFTDESDITRWGYDYAFFISGDAISLIASQRTKAKVLIWDKKSNEPDIFKKFDVNFTKAIGPLLKRSVDKHGIVNFYFLGKPRIGSNFLRI